MTDAVMSGAVMSGAGDVSLLHQRIRAIAGRRPAAPAVVSGADTLDYASLVDRAGRLANWLHGRGIRAEDTVVVLMEKSVHVVVAALAAWHLGAAYLPMDHRTPPERVRAVLSQLPGRHVVIDGPMSLDPAQPPDVTVTPDNVAYLVHTSGSTGVPKLVAVTHRALTAAYDSWAGPLDLTGRIRSHLQVASLGFDAHHGDLARSLLSGGRLVLCPTATALEPAALHRLLHDQHVDAMLITPSVVRLLMDWLEHTGHSLRRLRQVALGGEPWTVDDFRRLRALVAPDTRVLNFYGVAEASVDSMWCEVDGLEHIPLGRPFPGVGIAVTGPTGDPVPVGEVGELRISGPTLARGYVGRPAETAARFVAGPDGTRAYRTGDLVRRLPDDVLVYHGRVDDQVKVRGVRVQLAEVEAVLAAHPRVRAAAVVARRRAGETVLVGYVVAEPDAVGELRAHAAARLPDAMVPAEFVTCSSLPLTPTGKVDRRALPESEAPAVSVAPATPAEVAVAQVWQALLGRPPASVDEDLFAAGAGSLTAARFAVELGRVLGRHVPVGTVFRTPTVAGLAKAVESADEVEPPEPDDLASPAQRRLWLLAQLRPADAAYHVPTLVDLDGPLDVDRLGDALTALVNRHSALRTVFRAAPDGLTRRVLPAASVPLAVVDSAESAAAFCREPFDLAQGPLTRAALHRLGEHRHRLLIVTHHLVTDGWSVRVLLRELGELYAGRADLPAAPVEPRIALRPESRAYWLRELADPPAPLVLPGLTARAGTGASRGDRRGATLGPELTARLRAIAAQHRTTLFATLLAALTGLLHRWSGQQDLVVGAPFGDRDRPETQDVVGLLVSTQALRMAAGPRTSFDELVRRARRAVTGAVAHRDMPFDVLVHDLGLSGRDGNPLFRVWLNLLGTPPAPPVMPGLRTSIVQPPLPGALFDLTLYVTEVDDRLELELVHDVDAMDAAYAVELLDQFVRLLDACCADPDAPVSRHSLGAAELPDLRATPPPLLATLAERTGDAIAMSEPNGTWTYDRLWATAGGLAAQLPGSGTIVPILTGRDAGSAPALLGVLASGAEFVVLDADQPVGRLTGLLDQIGATHGVAVATVPAELRDRLQWIELGPTAPPRMHGEPGYVAFTSGTTGAPRGVRGTAAAVAHFLSWYVERFGITADDRFAMLSAPGHDPLLRDVLTPLWVGGTLCVPPPSAARAPGALLAWLRDERVTVAHLTPPLVRLLASAPNGTVPSLRLLVVGGDTLHREDVDSIAGWAPNALVVNAYGATETPQVVAFHPVSASQHGPVPVGTAAPGAQLLVVNPAGAPAAVGELGRIVVRGPFLAEGYLDDAPGGFGPDPVPGHTRFDTGDLGRRRPDGTVELVGRADDQVKVRGFRVAPAEVNRWLRSLPGVLDCATLARRGPDGENQLVCYVVGEALSADRVRARLRDRLPGYMVPADIVTVPEIPLTRNGKPDRSALAALTRTGPPAPVRRAGRGAPVEDQIAGVWRELLGAVEIDPERTFFDLGASSLLMVRAQQALQLRLRRDVPVTALFEHPTVRQLAAHLDPASTPSPATGGPARERPRPDLRARRLAARGVQTRAAAEEGAQHT